MIRGIATRLWWKCVWLKKEGKSHCHACAKCYLGRAGSASASVSTGPLLTWAFSFKFSPSLTYITVQKFRLKKKLLPSDVQQVWVKDMCCKTGLWGSTVSEHKLTTCWKPRGSAFLVRCAQPILSFQLSACGEEQRDSSLLTLWRPREVKISDVTSYPITLWYYQQWEFLVWWHK